KLSRRRIAVDPGAYLSAAVAEVLAAIPLADPETNPCRRQMAAILKRAEVAVIQILCEVKMPEGIPDANRDGPVRDRKPAQPFRPLTLGSVPVGHMIESEAAGKRKIPGAIVNPAVPAFGQKIQLRGVKRGEDRHTRESP